MWAGSAAAGAGAGMGPTKGYLLFHAPMSGDSAAPPRRMARQGLGVCFSISNLPSPFTAHRQYVVTKAHPRLLTSLAAPLISERTALRLTILKSNSGNRSWNCWGFTALGEGRTGRARDPFYSLPRRRAVPSAFCAPIPYPIAFAILPPRSLAVSSPLLPRLARAHLQ